VKRSEIYLNTSKGRGRKGRRRRGEGEKGKERKE
jgi:hypothetical protein